MKVKKNDQKASISVIHVIEVNQSASQLALRYQIMGEVLIFASSFFLMQLFEVMGGSLLERSTNVSEIIERCIIRHGNVTFFIPFLAHCRT